MYQKSILKMRPLIRKLKLRTLSARIAVILAVLAIGCQSGWGQSAAPPVEKIVIQHIGPPAASDDLIKANIKTKPGDPYVRANIDEDVRTLYSTGYFYNIRVGEEKSDQGVVVTYFLQGKPVLTEIQFSGNKKYSRSKLLKKISSKTGQPLDEHKLFSDTKEILKMYQKAGMQKTQVKYTLNIDENAGKGSVTFEIVEAPKVKIREVQFVGANAFPQKKLRKVIKTRKHWMFSWLTGSGVLKDEQFLDDKEKLAEFYRNEGYIDFEIKDVQFEQLSPKWMTIKIIVSEGKQYKVGHIEFKGNELFKSEDILKGVVVDGKPVRPEMLPGKTFTPKALTKDLQAIEDFYGSKGYIDVQIVANKIPNVETGTMDVVYEIEEKDKSYIEKIEIKGNVKTKDRVIRRELAVSPGEVFDMTRVKLSQRRLEGLNYFDKVEAKPEPTDVPNRKNLVIGVEEAPTGNIMVGAGFSTVDNVVGFAEWYQGNFDLFKPPWFMGGGQKFRIRAQLGTKRKDYVVTFVEPWFTGRRLALTTELYYRELDYLSYNDLYNLEQVGARIGLSKALGSEFLIGSVSYTIENIGLIDVSPNAPQIVKDDAGHTLISKVGASIAYDTRNNALMPERGQRTELSGEIAGKQFGGDRDFYKIELKSSWYFPGLFSGHVLEVTGNAGVVDSYSGSRLPFFERWFLGGLYTLRGYRYRYVSPRDSVTGEPIGGRSYVFGCAEYTIPIVERVKFAIFYDVGTVNLNAYDFGFSDYNDDWGIGIRINIPRMGPLRLDYAFPITHGPNSSSGRFQFGVGYTRQF